MCTFHKSILILLSKLLMKSANITRCSHKSTYGFVLQGTVTVIISNGGPPADLLIKQGVRDNVSGHTTRAPHCFKRLRQGALQNSHCAALPGSIVGHTNSGPFICSLLSDLCAQLFCGAVANFTIILAFPFWLPGALGVRGIQNNTELRNHSIAGQ